MAVWHKLMYILITRGQSKQLPSCKACPGSLGSCSRIKNKDGIMRVSLCKCCMTGAT